MIKNSKFHVMVIRFLIPSFLIFFLFFLHPGQFYLNPPIVSLNIRDFAIEKYILLNSKHRQQNTNTSDLSTKVILFNPINTSRLLHLDILASPVFPLNPSIVYTVLVICTTPIYSNSAYFALKSRKKALSYATIPKIRKKSL